MLTKPLIQWSLLDYLICLSAVAILVIAYAALCVMVQEWRAIRWRKRAQVLDRCWFHCIKGKETGTITQLSSEDGVEIAKVESVGSDWKVVCWRPLNELYPEGRR